MSLETARSFLSRYFDRKPNTRARYTTYLRGYFAHLGIILDLRVKVPRSLPPLVPAEDIQRLIGSIARKQTHKKARLRDRVLVETAAKTGLRRSELANLRVRDIDFTDSRLKVVAGKGAKDRVIPLASSAKSGLNALCMRKSPDDRVFGLKPRSLGNMIRTWANRAGVDLHTHSFRHHFATTLVDLGANLRAVQELLGHTNLNTTQLYLAVTGKHLEDAIGLLDGPARRRA